ncbi:MAG: HAMP domain-containing histidine kinase [Actinomycetota bacterium]|nr:HAMP domain-containing histidine kinase [Actinomycetota bacterium]
MPVRIRITAAVVLLVGLALTGAGFVVYVLQLRQIDENVNAAITQELEEFQQFQVESSEAFTGPADLIKANLRTNVAGENELFVGFIDGEWAFAQQNRYSDRSAYDDLKADPRLAAGVNEELPGGGSFRLDTALGPSVVTVQPVASANQAADGAFVILYLLSSDRTALGDVMRTYAIVAFLSLIAISATAYGVAGRLLRPVRRIHATAQRISDTDLSRRLEVTGNDDLTDLSHTFNAMLDRLEEAFDGQRQFLDDAGHELRTPITIVRGHLELLDANDAAEVKTTTSLVIDEVDRMSRLVDDLILLAKTRRPDFLRPEWLDLGELTDDIADKVRGFGDRAWSVDHRGRGSAFVDRQRMNQAMLQLVDNAVRHTEVGDCIAIGSIQDDAVLRLWVRDTGVGIAYEHQQVIFDRFRQVDPNTLKGSGLGLSIVSAIVRAHGGEVEVTSVPGGGSTFTVTLPYTDPSWSAP